MIMIDGTKKDADRMEFFANKITKPVESDFDIDHDLIDEFLRLSGLELNSVATYMGGLAAQETIKVVLFRSLFHRSQHISSLLQDSSFPSTTQLLTTLSRKS